MKKIKFSIPHNWQSDLIKTIDLTYVSEFYGKLSVDVVGGGRSSNICLPVSRRAVAEEIKRIHSKGLKFNYLLNATCLDNKELSFFYKRDLRRLLNWLQKLSVDSITVSLPHILGVIKKSYPNFKIYVSTMAQVDTPDKAKFWEDLGVSKITLYEVNVNRNFDLIKKIRAAVQCELQLIVNNGCLYDCPFTINHGLLCSHASQEGHILKGFVVDFYRIMCTYKRINDPVNFIRADWIRPEDLSYYEDLGVDSIKIVNRAMTTSSIADIIEAYTKRRYEGNLLDLLPSPSKNINFMQLNPFHLFKFFFHPGFINIFKLVRVKKVFAENNIYIDNKRLDGFLLSLQNKNCSTTLCDDCGYCKEMMEKVIKLDCNKIDCLKKETKELLNQFISGDLFKYFARK